MIVGAVAAISSGGISALTRVPAKLLYFISLVKGEMMLNSHTLVITVFRYVLFR